MVKKLSLSLFLFLSGCGFYPVDSGFIDPEFIPYVEEYKIDKKKYLDTSKLRKVSIIFKTLDGSTRGECSTITYKSRLTDKTIITYRHIYIDPSFWFGQTYLYKKLLIYHELGHCDLDFLHTDEETIMNPYGLIDSFYITNPDHYLNLFFYEGK